MSKNSSLKSTAWILSAAVALTTVVCLLGPLHWESGTSLNPDPDKSSASSSTNTARDSENPTPRTAAPAPAAIVATTPSTNTPLAQSPPADHPAPTTDKDLSTDFIDRIVAGNKVAFTLPDGRAASGGVEMIQRDAHGILFVQGRLTLPDPGSYFFQRQTVPGVAGPLAGNVRFDGKDDGWKIEPTANLSAARLNARKLDDIICANYEKMPEAVEGEVEFAPQTHPYPVPFPYYQSIIPLQSLPGATAVIYLDFDGEQGPFSGWGNFNAAPANASNSQIFDVWKMVCEDYQGFNINITTDRKIFDKAPQGRRQHCIITPTNTAAPGAGGVSYLESFNWSGDTVNWAFYSSGKSAAEVISHECGHALGLSHDGRNNPSEGYYNGHGSGSTGWAPIMGAGYYENLTQWSKGEYLSANQTQDDLSIIVNNNNDVDYRTDDTGDVQSSARYLEILADNSVSNEGIIERTGDIDAFRFATAGGQVTLNVNTVALNPNLDILAEIVNAATSAVVTSNNPDLGINATVSANLPAGEYLLRVRGTGRGNPLGDGYTNYGSLGSYLITGSVAGGIKSERFSIAENTVNGTAVGTVVARNNHAGAALTYAIASGNTNGAFAINSATGAITVANSSVLDFEALSLRWDDPATFEMFVTITDASNPSLNENLRTVVTVTDLNEAPFITGGSISLLEHMNAGTNVFKVVANETDHFDFAKYSITAGNTGNAFAIDANTGQITLATNLDVSGTTVYNLTVKAADQGTPPMTSTATVAITVVNIPDGYLPGKVVRTYFENIPGSSLADLTSNANFPNNPSSQEFLTSFDGQSHGDNFGSTIQGYLIPPTTGTYQFWIASDDASELRLSSNATAANATVRATVTGWTNPYAWTANASQQSAAVNLTAGQPYYIEARHKEGSGGDHVEVAWAGPGITQQVISGLYLAPYFQNYPPKTNAATYAIRENALAGQSFGILTSSDLNAQDTFSYTITGGNTGGVFGINPATGQLTVAKSGLLNATTTPTYTLTIQSTDNGTPALSGSGTVTVNVLPPTSITGTGIVQEIWTGISGTAVSNLTSGNANYPNKPNLRRSLTSFDSGVDYADNYGSRVRVKFIPPTTDNYRFYLASDDDSSLLYSASATGSGASQIAYVSGWTDHNVWTKYASQASAVKSLVAGQAVYLETLQKDGGGGDHVSVAYTNSTVTTPTVIPGTMLQPIDINAAPAFSPASYSYNVAASTATAGMVLGTVTAADPNNETLVYAILSGNSQGAFAINSSTGVITVATPAELSIGDATLQIAAQDGGLGGVYPFASATATVVVHVTAIDSVPMPTFSLAAGNYFGAQSVTITCAQSGATIYYTTDGSLPTTGSAVYTGAITIPVDSTLTLKAFATAAGSDDSAVASATYGTTSANTAIWNNPAGGSWPVTGNWLNGAVGRGSGINALFNTLTLTGQTGVTLDGPLTLGGLAFKDLGNLYSWSLNPGSGGTLTLAGTLPTVAVENQTATLAVNLAGTNGLVKSGSGTLTLSGTNIFSGGTTVNSGILKLSGANSGNSQAGTGTLTINSGAIVEANSHNALGLSGGAALSPLVINGGTFLADAYNHINSVTLTGGTIGIRSGVSQVDGLYMTTRNSVPPVMTSLASATTSTVSSKITLANNSTFSVADGTAAIDLTVSGTIVGSGTFTKTGAGTLALTAANTYSAGTTINDGRLIVKDSGTAYDSLSTSIAPGAFLEFNTSASGNTQQLNNNGQTLTGTGTIEKTGPGQLWFGGNGQFVNISLGSGALIDVYDGILRNEYGVSGGGNWSANLADLNIRSTATVNVWDGNITVDGLTGTGIVEKGQSGTTTLTIGVDNAANPSFGGTIKNTTGTLAFIKTGTGSQTLGGANTYTGTTTVNQGSLIVTGSLANTATTVAAAGTLGGTGTIAGTVANNGTLAPGTTGAGNLTVSNTLTLAPSSAIAWQVADWTGTAGTGYDKLTVNSLNLTATSANRVTIRISQQALANFTETSKTFTLLQSTAAISGFDPAKFVLDTSGFTSGAGTWAVQQSGNNLVLAYTRANTTPVFASNPIAMAATQGIAMSGSISGVDPDIGEILTYSKVSGPSWLAVASNGSLSGTPAAGDTGANSFTVRVTDSGGLFGDATLIVQVAADTGSDANANGILDAWEIEKFGNADPGSNPANADPDHDGLSNLMEFAIGTHPAQTNANPLALGFATIGPDKFLQLTVPKNPSATNIGYEVEASGDLVAATWSAASTVIVSETASTLIVRDATPVQSAGKRFLRLKVHTLP